MDLKFSEMSVDTTLAQEYLKQNELLLELYNNYNETIEKYSKCDDDSLILYPGPKQVHNKDDQTIFKNLALKLKQNASLIAQLEYHIRNIPIEVTHAQLNLLIQYFRSWKNMRPWVFTDRICRPDDPLLVLEHMIWMRNGNPKVKSRAPVAICQLLVTLYREAGFDVFVKLYKDTVDTNSLFLNEYHHPHFGKDCQVKGLGSGTVAVVSDDADVDSAVDKFISVSKQAPWRLKRILVQETVYQEFKEALTWKCKLNKSGSKAPTHNVLCSDTLTYNDVTFLIDPVQLTEEQPSVVIVEAYRTTKEMIALVQQYKARYLSLWINGVAEINEVTHSTMAPVVWVNTVADFRGPPQVSHAVFSGEYPNLIKKCDKVAKLCELLQSWQKLDFESRRDILCGVLDEYILLDPENKLYTDIRHSISSSTQKSFVDVGKDYVCVGMLQPMGIMVAYDDGDVFSVKGFESFLQGNAFIVVDGSSPYYSALDLKGVPVVNLDELIGGDFKVSLWNYRHFMQTRVIWTNSGTIFAN